MILHVFFLLNSQYNLSLLKIIEKWLKSKGENVDLTGLGDLIKNSLDAKAIWDIVQSVFQAGFTDLSDKGINRQMMEQFDNVLKKK